MVRSHDGGEFLNLEEMVTKPIVESVIDSLLVVDRNMEDYWDKVATEGFFQQDVADLNENLTQVARGIS